MAYGFGNLEIKSKSKFLRIEAGQPQDVRLLEESPKERIVHGFGKEAEDCAGEGCQQCSAGDEPSQRFTVNVYNHTLKKVQLWEFGGGIAKQLKNIAKTAEEDKQSILDIDLKADAEGSNKSKKYKITPRMTNKPLPNNLVLLSTDGDIPF